jgi:hypothetical protein
VCAQPSTRREHSAGCRVPDPPAEALSRCIRDRGRSAEARAASFLPWVSSPRLLGWIPLFDEVWSWVLAATKPYFFVRLIRIRLVFLPYVVMPRTRMARVSFCLRNCGVQMTPRNPSEICPCCALRLTSWLHGLEGRRSCARGLSCLSI